MPRPEHSTDNSYDSLSQSRIPLAAGIAPARCDMAYLQRWTQKVGGSMNSITRLILRHVVSGKVTLTPQVIKVLKEINQEDPNNRARATNAQKETPPPPDKLDQESPAVDTRLTFENPLPGRWVRRTSCFLGGALLLIAGSLHATNAADTFQTANNGFAQDNYAEAAAVANPSVHNTATLPRFRSI